MAMSPEIQEEYDAALKEATLRHGSITNQTGGTVWGWENWEDTQHFRGCGGHARDEVQEDDWYEFAGTFAGPEEGHKHGLIVRRVDCFCGRIVDRSIRWEADRSAIAEAVFEIALGPKR
jgi:hypothetical protein